MENNETEWVDERTELLSHLEIGVKDAQKTLYEMVMHTVDHVPQTMRTRIGRDVQNLRVKFDQAVVSENLTEIKRVGQQTRFQAEGKALQFP